MSRFNLILFVGGLLIIGQYTEALAQVKRIRRFDLKEIVQLSTERSPAALQARNAYLSRYWQYRNFRSNYLPQLRLESTVPDFIRSIDGITQPDGTIAFPERAISSSTAQLSLRQNIAKTGGSVFVSSGLTRFDNLTTRNSSYNSNPLRIGFFQPLFQFNQLGWDNKLEPLRFEESQKQFKEDLEEASLNAIRLYFNLLQAQVNLQVAEQNRINTDTLFKIAQGRYNLGKIAENELLSLELSLMNAQQQVLRAQLDVRAGTLSLKAALGLTDTDEIILEEPVAPPVVKVAEEKALEQALSNRARVVGFKRELLNAEREVAQARGETGFTANLSASVGLTQQAGSIDAVYRDPQNQQNVNLSFGVPILDWGRTTSRRKTATANYDLVKTVVGQQEQNFKQEIFLLTKQYEMASLQLDIASKSNVVAQKRYDIAAERYKIGKISITDLNIALQEKDAARGTQVDALRNFWEALYQLRKNTLYDFVSDTPIEHPLPNN